MGKRKIVITGAPGTGKTAVIQALEAKGFPCFPEIIREMTSRAKQEGAGGDFVSNPLVFVQDALEFNSQLLQGRAGQYLEAERSGGPISFFDRGIPDVLAYMDYFGQPYGREFLKIGEDHRYDSVFILPPWEEIYVSDNERLESFDQAEALHHALVEAYARLGYVPLEVPRDTVERRIAHILETLKEHL